MTGFEIHLRLPKTKAWAVRPLVLRGVLTERETELSAVWFWPVSTAELPDLVAALQACQWRRGAVVTVNGRMVSLRHLTQMMVCYLQSLAVEDPRAHCWLSMPGRELVLPCRLVEPIWRHDPAHPSSARQRMEAALVQRGTRWCPRLRLDEWELLFGYKRS